MGRIVVSVDIQNVASPERSRQIDALVDTGASHITLPRLRRAERSCREVAMRDAYTRGTGVALSP